MFNFSGSEIVFLLLLALIVLGPEKLPEAVRKFGKTYGEFKKMTTGFQSELKSALDEPMREMRETADAFKKAASFDFDGDGKPDEKPADKPAEVKPAEMKTVAQPTKPEPTKAPPATASPATFSAAPPLRHDPQDVPADEAPDDETELRPDPDAPPPARGIDSVVVRDAPVGRAPTKVTPTPAPAKAPSTNKASNFRRAPKPDTTPQADHPDEPAPADDSPNGEQGAASA